MEWQDVFRAARYGQLNELKRILDHKLEDEVTTLVSVFPNGTTPLVSACTNGHLDVVTYLLQKCHADVDQVGYGDHGLIDFIVEIGSPLYWATLHKHLNIVETLMKYNASVKGTARTKSPLVAVYGDLKMAKYLIGIGADMDLSYNEEESTCLMLTCTSGSNYEIVKYLLDCGSDVNRKNVHGDTALHFCARSGALVMIKLLLEHGAIMSRNERGVTPLVSAASWNYPCVVEYFIEECNCTKEDKVDALELLGAALVDDDRDMWTAGCFWRRAFELRYEDSSYPLEKPDDKSPISSYINETEVRIFDKLDMLTDDEMEIQALLVRVRILGQCHPDSINCIQFKGSVLAQNGNFEKCIKLLMCILDAEIDQKEVIYSTIKDFINVFCKMMCKTWDFARDMPKVSLHDILYVLERAILEIKRYFNVSRNKGMDLNEINDFHDFLITTLHLVHLMCILKPYLTVKEEISFKKAVYKLVCMNPKGQNGFTLLHFATYRVSLSCFSLPNVAFSLEMVNLLLEVGACPNAVDSNKNTPLHLAAMNRPCDTNIFYSLLHQGAHLDLCNNENKTPLQLLPDVSLLNINPLQYLNLQCLSAQAVNKYQISYKGLCSKRVCGFVESHGMH